MRTTSIGLLALLLVACGGGEEPIAAPAPTTSPGVPSTTAPTPISAAPSPTAPATAPTTPPPAATGAGEADGTLHLCAEVPNITTDVIGDLGGAANPDPIFTGVIRTYANEHPDVYASLLIDRQSGGTIVLAVTDDPQPHRAALAQRRPQPTDDVGMEPPPPIDDARPIGEWGTAFDVVQVDFTEAELLATQQMLLPLQMDPDVPIDGSSGGGLRNRVELYAGRAITTDEVATITAVVDELAPLEMVCLDASVVDELPPTIEPGTPLDVIELPGPGGDYPPDTPVQCGGIPFALGQIQPLRPLAEHPDLLAVIEQAASADETSFVPAGQEWWLLDLADDTASAISLGERGFTMVPLEQTRAGWAVTGLSGASECDVQRTLPPGLGGVEWVLDPAFPEPTADSTELYVLVTELACAGAREMGDQLLGPQVVETHDAVRIAFAVIPLTGAQTCPGNPPAAVTVALDAPLGDREIRDGLTIGPFDELVRFG